MHKVAIVLATYSGSWNGDSIANHISEWVEVDNNQFKSLVDYLSSNPYHEDTGMYSILIEQKSKVEVEEVVNLSVKAYLDKAYKDTVARQMEVNRREEAAKKRKLKKEEKERKMLEELQVKYGNS